MPITVQFEESCERTSPEEARQLEASRGDAGPHRRARPVNRSVKARESQRFQKFVRSVKEKKEALEQERLAHQEAEIIAREEARIAVEESEATEDGEELSPEERATEQAQKEEDVTSILLELTDIITTCGKPPSRLVREAPSTLVTTQQRRVLSDSNTSEPAVPVPQESTAGKRVLRSREKRLERQLDPPPPPKQAATTRRPPRAQTVLKRSSNQSAPTVPPPAPMASSSLQCPTDPVVVVKGNKRKPNLSACYNRFRTTIVKLLGKEALVAFQKTSVNSTAGYLWRQLSQEEKVTFGEQTEGEQRALLERAMHLEESEATETQLADGKAKGEVTKSGRPKRNVAGSKKLKA